MGNLINHSKGSKVSKVKMVYKECLAQPITKILDSGCWQDQSCFIIGGGPSLIDFDWRWIQGSKVIGINKSFLTYHAEINYAMDNVFFDLVNYDPGAGKSNHEIHIAWKAYRGIKVFVRHKQERFASDIYYVNALPQKGFSFDLSKGIYPGDNSGFGAMMLAVALGVKRIGLLGFDFYVEKNKTHFHDGYKNQNPENLAKKLIKFRNTIDAFASGFENLGIQVINLSEKSLLQNYPKSDIKTFLDK